MTTADRPGGTERDERAMTTESIFTMDTSKAANLYATCPAELLVYVYPWET
jgi:hypothetical protein